MAKVVVVVSYDIPEGEPQKDLAIEVVKVVRPLLEGRPAFEAHVATGLTATNVIFALSDQRVR